MNDYEAKQEARRARLARAADRADRLAAALHKQADTMAKAIPFGQPILIGHHSEGRDRRYRERMQLKLRRGFQLMDRAKALRSAAASVGSGGISADDPDAIGKLREELAAVERAQAQMRAANPIVRAFYKAGVRDEASADLWTRYLSKIREALPGLSEARAKQLLQPDFCGRIGFADYALSNNNANAHRIRRRIADLERNAARAPSEHDFGAIKVREDADDNRVHVTFPGKPADSVRAELKRNGFRWSPNRGAWVRQRNALAVDVACRIARSAANAS